MRDLYDIDAVAALIRRGGGLMLAGEEAALRQLPRGDWIGGTIPYFMTPAGGCVDRERVFVSELPPGLRCAGIRRYRKEEIARVYADIPPGALGVVIAPASSDVHLRFALEAPTFPGFASRPLFGWISGVHLSQLGAGQAKVHDGAAGAALTDEAVVMHVALPPGKRARIGMVNLFRQGAGPAITFPSSGFVATDVDVDGTRRNLAEYVTATRLDTRLPLVADYCGLDVNVSFQSVDPGTGEVRFYAPVFANVPYRHAQPVGDYVSEFLEKVPGSLTGDVILSCNCILNYLHSGLEGKKVGDLACPMTFGEIAYQLLNQTLAYVAVG